ncbi:hypothetical protein V3W47_06700 [Deinococcus sp. YIM 134068]
MQYAAQKITRVKLSGKQRLPFQQRQGERHQRLRVEALVQHHPQVARLELSQGSDQ